MCLASRRLSGNGPHLAWRGEPPGFSRVAAAALDLRRGPRDPLWWPQEMPVPMRVARGPLGIPLPSMPGRKTLCACVCVYKIKHLGIGSVVYVCTEKDNVSKILKTETVLGNINFKVIRDLIT